MVERVNQAQSLIEKLLRFCVLGRDRMVQIAQARHPRDRLLRPRSMTLRGCQDRETNENRKTKSRDAASRASGATREQFHKDILPIRAQA
jgi:hypothetical protein